MSPTSLLRISTFAYFMCFEVYRRDTKSDGGIDGRSFVASNCVTHRDYGRRLLEETAPVFKSLHIQIRKVECHAV